LGDGVDWQMRNLVSILVLLAAGVLGFIVLLPVLGIIIVLIVAVIGLFFALPLLARLPWFRNRIIVHRFDGRTHTRYGGAPPEEEPPRVRLDHGDVIDVEGRELPEGKAEKRD